ncbi:protein transport protein Sec24C isoform X1 [Synchiropus splendidus]|uniref:protein transport protein Sec24C isoform X1 n=2 Tax=Synchiropus splendidus TaxID=270530 RepID=UPI00237D3F37|nr:protein transport protein Sec24C isoform X1 [Synchiropus splendidus]
MKDLPVLPFRARPRKNRANQWRGCRMMDVPPANQSQTPCQWADYSSWSSPCSPLPALQHLSVGSPQTQSSSSSSCNSSFGPPYHQAYVNGGQVPPPSSLPLPSKPHQASHVTPHCVQQVSPAPLVSPGFQNGPQMNPTVPLHPASPVQPAWLLPPNRGAEASEPDHGVTLQSPTSESRYGLNPELLPSAVKVMADDAAAWADKVFMSEPFSGLPPLPTTLCVFQDRGNVSPRVIRPTSYCAPFDGQMALRSRVPMGAVVTPLAGPADSETPPPLCREEECVSGCRSCGAYMCSAVSWQDCGQRFYCPFCGKLSEVSWQHYQPTAGVQGARVDREKRPELHMGSYEILSSQKDEAAVLLLAVDVSACALRTGNLEFVTRQLHELLSSLKREHGGTRVGLITYDSRVHLYDLSLHLSRPHMLVLTDTEDLLLPVSEGLLVPLEDCVESLHSVFQLLPHFTPECDDSAGVSLELPVRAGLAVLQTLKCPGKLLLFHTAPLTEIGPSTTSGFFGSNKPKTLFQPSDGAISLAKQCVSQGCGVHLFFLAFQDVGGAWPGHVPYLTGGALHSYSHLQGELDQERFSSDLRRTVKQDTGYKAELLMFVNKDVRVSGCYGMFVPGPSPSKVAMATVDSWTSLAVELAHSRALEEPRGLVLQAVLKYSTQCGERRIRVHTLTLKCSRHLQDTYRNCQAQTLLTFYCKKMYCGALERPLQELREELQTEVTELLASYRKHCGSSSVSAGQLVLPQHLRALPVYVNSLRKSEVLLPGVRSSVHQRLQQRCQVVAMDPLSTATHFYPRLLPLFPALSGSLAGEAALRCSAASLDPGALYLVHAPLALLLWVGAEVPACTLAQLFNTSCFSSLPSGETKLPPLENSVSARVRSLVDSLNSQVSCARTLLVVKQGDACKEVLQRHLVEDKSPNGGASYADFLYHLHVNSVRLLQ